MVKNTKKYNKSRFLSYIKGLIPSFFSYFIKRDSNLVIFNSLHNLSFSDNTKFLFLYMKENSNKLIKYVINDDKLREKLTKQYGNYFIETNTFKGKLFALHASIWFVNAFELPVNGIFLRFRRTVIHLTHGAPIKNGGLCENDVSLIKRIYYAILGTNISYTVSSSEILRNYLAKHIGISNKRVIISSYPRYDMLFSPNSKKIKDSFFGKRILYAPTWRHYADVNIFPFPDLNSNTLQSFLSENNIIIYLRLHPRFESECINKLHLSKNIQLFSGHDYPDINEWLPNFDALITDYSSIMYDFMLLDRPIFYFDYDYEEYNKQVGFALDYKQYAVGYHVNSQKEFCEMIIDAFTKDVFKSERNRICSEITPIKTDCCKSLVDKLQAMNVF